MTDISDIKTKLEAKLRELDMRTHEIDEALSQPGDDNWSESAVEAESDEVMEEVGNLALEEIRKIRAALASIDAGTYGICKSCGKKIAPKRLEAIPYTGVCIDCA